MAESGVNIEVIYSAIIMTTLPVDDYGKGNRVSEQWTREQMEWKGK